jgi:hypothetical protein
MSRLRDDIEAKIEQAFAQEVVLQVDLPAGEYVKLLDVLVSVRNRIKTSLLSVEACTTEEPSGVPCVILSQTVRQVLQTLKEQGWGVGPGTSYEMTLTEDGEDERTKGAL